MGAVRLRPEPRRGVQRESPCSRVSSTTPSRIRAPTSNRARKSDRRSRLVATALGQIPTTTATQPAQTTLAGHAATYIEITIPASPPCSPEQFYLWQDSPHAYWWALAPSELIRVWVVEVGGQRVAIAARSRPGTSAAVNGELQGILDSIVFEVPPTEPGASPAASPAAS